MFELHTYIIVNQFILVNLISHHFFKVATLIFVKDMIRRLADDKDTQFITTTFRPELVKVADKIYSVTHKNKVSRVNVVSKDIALDFIDQDQTRNAAE